MNNISNNKLVELSQEELGETQGGILGIVLVAAVGLVAGYFTGRWLGKHGEPEKPSLRER